MNAEATLTVGVVLSLESVEAIARRVIELQRENAPLAGDSDPRLTREQAAAYLNISPRSFDRKRELFPDALRPADLHPLRWSRNALDVFKATGGTPQPARRGRKPATLAAA